jgi:aminoglycoside phosphotransferase (APT) family kinase protein
MSDASAVREGEEQDWRALEHWLRATLGDELDSAAPMEPLQFPAGAANLTYLLRFGSTELVVRRPPFGPVPPGAHDMAREYRVLSRLWRIFPRAPRAFAFCEDESVLGAPFLVMERRRGVVIHDEIPESMRPHPDVARRVSFALVDAMADFHALDPAAAGLSELGRPDGFVERQVAGWQQRWERARLEPLPVMDAVHERLARHRPESVRSGFVHNDLKLDNCQFDPADPDRVTSIFDWDMTTLGDPLIDLGTLLGYWPDPEDTEVRASRPGWQTMGLPPRREIAARYAERARIAVDSIDWYEAFALWKTAVVLQQIYLRYVRGQTSDPRFADRGARVPVLAGLAEAVLDRAGLH